MYQFKFAYLVKFPLLQIDLKQSPIISKNITKYLIFDFNLISIAKNLELFVQDNNHAHDSIYLLL